jgi:hypothetical protein
MEVSKIGKFKDLSEPVYVRARMHVYFCVYVVTIQNLSIINSNKFSNIYKFKEKGGLIVNCCLLKEFKTKHIRESLSDVSVRTTNTNEATVGMY